ncbi:MAG: M23 family metallopeptidase [Clostridia bacterium]|nr:M23 family metallopeptidase [Clostridia bacterium]
MRRENRRKNLQGSSTKLDKVILYAGIGVAILTVIVFCLFMYSKGLNDNIKNSTMNLEEMANITNNTQSASTEIGKTVEESKNEVEKSDENATNNTTSNTDNTNNSNNITNNTSNKSQNNTIKNTNTTKANNTAKVTTNTKETNEKQEKKETKKELVFAKPVEGEAVREYAKDNLIYSETLKEWTTHMGIDIKADKTTVVKAAEAGTVKTIKNDPRYGLTIVIEHEDNFQTVYSNLLTSEFVVEGEKVEKGQSIGTVGNTAVFEIADEPHLHFEILKDSLPVDPSIYIK